MTTDGPSARQRLRVASLNLRALQDDVDALVRVVRAVDPDVLCVQEVPWIGPAGHRIAGFAARCGLVWSGRERRAGQTSLLTSLRVEVLGSDHLRLPGSSLRDRRGVAMAEVAPVGGRPVSVASVHLSLDPAERVRHARLIRDLVGRRGHPVVVAGDLNETPGSAAWSTLAEGLVVASTLAPTFPAARPDRIIDVVLADPTLLAEAGAPGRGEPRVDPADLVAGTDHRPVWADLVVPG